MAVAFGIFRPNEYYVSTEHATALDGIERFHADKLRLCWADGKPLICDAVGLIDCAAEAGDDGREVNAFGVRDIAFLSES
jgi:hypothetical protein